MSNLLGGFVAGLLFLVIYGPLIYFTDFENGVADEGEHGELQAAHRIDELAMEARRHLLAAALDRTIPESPLNDLFDRPAGEPSRNP